MNILELENAPEINQERKIPPFCEGGHLFFSVWRCFLSVLAEFSEKFSKRDSWMYPDPNVPLWEIPSLKALYQVGIYGDKKKKDRIPSDC